MPAGIGYFGEDAHDAIVREIELREAFYREQLAPKFRQMVRWWKLYLADKEDKRGEHEKWRANVFVPYPYSGVETMVASVTDIINASDPVVQAEGVGQEDERRARSIERVIDYTLRRNSWTKTQDLLYRAMGVQGTTIPKLIWMNRSRQTFVHPTQDEIARFNAAVQQAQQAGLGSPPEDPGMFEEWRQWVNLQVATIQPGPLAAPVQLVIPPAPIPGPREIIEYRGPWIDRTQIYDLRFDPQIENMQEQDLVIHRMVKTRQWVLDRASADPCCQFDARQVGDALQRTAEGRFTDFERDVAEMLGITNSESDPAYDDAVELWECWRPNAPDGARYCVILNRKTIINKDPTQLPYWHGQIPFIPIRNVSVPGHLLGISEIQEPEKLYYEMNALRNLRLDAVTLAVLPMFLKMREVGIADFQRHMKPGGIIEAGRADALQQLTKFGSDIGNAFRELDTIKADIDETNATPSHLRGSPSTVGRVSATEAERRFSQSLTRQKQRVLRIEDELQPMVRQMLFLWYQFGDPVVRVAAGDGQDSIAEVERDRFFEALELDFRFRGASKALNKDLLSQQLMTFLRDNRGDLTPRERRNLMRRIYETMGQKGGAEIISEEGTMTLEGVFQQQMAAAQAQQAAAGQGAPPEGAEEAQP